MSIKLFIPGASVALALMFVSVPQEANAQVYGDNTGRTYDDFICYEHNARGECTNYSYITPRASFRGNYWDSDFARGSYGRDFWNDDWQYRRPENRAARYYPRRHTDTRFRDDWYSGYQRDRYWDDRYEYRDNYQYRGGCCHDRQQRCDTRTRCDGRYY